jgi:hypothetical protein
MVVLCDLKIRGSEPSPTSHPSTGSTSEIEAVAGLMRGTEVPTGRVLIVKENRVTSSSSSSPARSRSRWTAVTWRRAVTETSSQRSPSSFGGPRVATVTVKENARVFVLGKAEFDIMLRKRELEDKILSAITERILYR